MQNAISKCFSGEKINETENRAVLHTALRANDNDTVIFEGKNVVEEIVATKNKIRNFTNTVVSGQIKRLYG